MADRKRDGYDVSFSSFGLILIIVGALLLLGNFFSFLSISMLWPLFMMIPVVIFIPLLMQDFKSNNGVLVPTGILTVLTAYFLWLNYTGWSNTRTTWPTFVLAPAVGLFLFYLANRRKALLIPVFILTAVSAVFYGVMLNSRVAIAACFILGGIAVLIGSFSRNKD